MPKSIAHARAHTHTHTHTHTHCIAFIYDQESLLIVLSRIKDSQDRKDRIGALLTILKLFVFIRHL